MTNCNDFDLLVLFILKVSFFSFKILCRCMRRFWRAVSLLQKALVSVFLFHSSEHSCNPSLFFFHIQTCSRVFDSSSPKENFRTGEQLYQKQFLFAQSQNKSNIMWFITRSGQTPQLRIAITHNLWYKSSGWTLFQKYGYGINQRKSQSPG